MVRDDILAFLRDPAAFSGTLSDASKKDWIEGLESFALPSIEAKQDWPLRPAQEAAWRGIAAHRVSLVLGPPGTGKTSALSWMALGYLEARRKAGKPTRILITGFTRDAIGNLLEAIAKRAALHSEQVPTIAYLGDTTPDLSPGIEHVPSRDGAALLQQECLIVGCTSWTLHKVLTKSDLPNLEGPTAPIFDLVCIDEASQMVLSQGLLSLSALTIDGRVLVAGDDKQLAPVRNLTDTQFYGRNLGTSLYGFLKNGEVAEFPLDETFRLNAPQTQFPADRFYEGNFRSAGVAQLKRLNLVDGWKEGLTPWEQLALDPEHPVCILLHDGPPAATNNPFEVHLVKRLVKRLWERMAGVQGEGSKAFWNDRLAVISPHRNQNAAIRQALKDRPYGEDLMVETVDRIQGRERDAIIASYTVSDEEFALAEAPFIFGAERLNVTITRSRTKLVMLVCRRLLEVVPADESVFDAAQALREFVFLSRDAGSTTISGPDGHPIQVSIRLRSFDNDSALPDLSVHLPEAAVEPLPEMNPELDEILTAIRTLSDPAQYHGWIFDNQLKKALARTVGFSELRALQRLGFVALKRFKDSWQILPLNPPLLLFPVDPTTVHERIEEAIEWARGGGGPLYERVRQRFDWLSDEGADLLRPHVEAMVMAGRLRWGADSHQRPTLEWVEEAPEALAPIESPSEPLEDEDFIVLNALEDLEARRINFGVFERWTAPLELARTLGRRLSDLGEPIRRLATHGYLMRTESGRLRSRMAELAREVRYVKQRFGTGDADRRPFLVRSIKLEVIAREKPKRDQHLSEITEELLGGLSGEPGAGRVVKGLSEMLRARWGVDPLLAGFQRRALNSILHAWVGREDDTFVITADTGSGKTEAACLPLIAGAALDLEKGISGTRAILVYPRIQLGANQAQRLTGYLAALERVEGFPGLTIGLQNGHVPKRFPISEQFVDQAELWKPLPNGEWTFPFFACPECDRDLLLVPGGGRDGIDRLCCRSCKWEFGGWVGTKDGLIVNPPSLFLPVTESLHQWLQNPAYASLFGAARAILADEIHLYSQIHGAQIGYMLRRLMARTDGEFPPIAIGMSATLGRPAHVWGSLSGRERVHEITPLQSERSENPKAREYFFFVQPEIESRGSDIAGASTTIQTLMLLAHGMRRRTGKEGGYRGIVFLDSIDKLKRLHGDYTDAEERKRLAQYRTRLYDDDSQSREPRRACCGSPETCGTFLKGECWHFAATDSAQWSARGRYVPGRNLTVCRSPVFSKNKGRVEEQIRQSDVVFATSSLEVGFDDPDMTLVYQHYAPVNLASFIQRKGRGGRGADDRPVTGVTLSAYSPRDTWYFRRPRLMLEPSGFEVPLNMENHFVRRGQAIAVLLDTLAAWKARTAGRVLPIPDAVFEEASRKLDQVFGAGICEQLGARSLDDLWDRAIADLSFPLDPEHPEKWREALPWVPTLLFSSINTPTLEVRYPGDQGGETRDEEDITLAFGECAPGNVTRRYGLSMGHWVRPLQGRHPHAGLDPSRCVWFEFGDPSELEQLLPVEARAAIGNLHPQIARPVFIRLEATGRQSGADWTPYFSYDSDRVQVVAKQDDLPEVMGKSKASMRGFLLVKADASLASPLSVPSITPIAERFVAYIGQPGGAARTGLLAARVYWASDVELVLMDRGRRIEAAMQQTFTKPGSNEGVLLGYKVETEGVQLHLDRVKLDAFLDAETARLRDSSEGRWLRAQFFCYLTQSRLIGEGLNTYQARQLADLLVTAMAIPETASRLKALLARWDRARFLELLLGVFRDHLAMHPLLTERRLRKLEDAIKHPSFGPRLREVVAAVQDERAFRGYLRSLVVHGLALRLQHAFVLHGRGDERRVLFHARLPVQFGDDVDDVITVLENGEHGDGTTRTFLNRLTEAFSDWTAEALAACPNAEEDALIERLDGLGNRAQEWRQLDPRDPASLDRVASELGLDATRNPGALQSIARLVWGTEELGSARFDLLDLRQEVAAARSELVNRIGREPNVWELVSAVVRQASNSELPTWGALLEAYRAIEDAIYEGSLSPEGRLADQVVRLSARLCADGCKACLHVESSLMPNSLAEVAVSREVLDRFARFTFRG